MSLEYFPKKPKKGPVELQLTAMIDVFSMIVIFLILGGIFGAPDIVVPADMIIPKSKSKEGIEAAPRLAILKDAVSFSMVTGDIPLSEFRNSELSAELIQKLKPQIEEYKKKQQDAKASVTPLNLIADQKTPYRDVYDVVAAFRKMGFNSILFIASGVGESK